ncbi:MAG: DUF4249 domain-containing protein [Chryseolinea sp.]
MKNILIPIIVLFIFSACEKTVELDLKQTEPRIIIEGQVTNKSNYQYVKVTKSIGFYDSGESPRVDNASVFVTDDQGNSFAFVHNPRNNADSMGYYLPSSEFAGEIGRTYKLTVSIDEQVYEGSDFLNPVTKIDSLTSRVNDDEKDDPKDYKKFYEILLYAKEPQATTDYYLFKFYRNDSLKVYNDTDIYFADDEVLGEDIDGIPSPIFFAPGDVGRVEMYSLSRDGFVFYNDLQNLLQNDGGLFSQPPSNSRSNLSNGALGFFQASAMEMRSISINQ